MKRPIAALLLAGLLFSLLPGCGEGTAGGEETVRVVASTYPVYLMATAITEGAEGVEVSLLVNQQTSCLHDYTLTVNDMKRIEGADVIILSGAGLEDFMADALAASDAQIIDCSAGLDLLEAQPHSHEGHDFAHYHDENCAFDPHYWLGEKGASAMLNAIAECLGSLHGERRALYEENLARADAQLAQLADKRAQVAALERKYLITFHDGFRYLADSCGLTILKSIEEEEGSEASAAEIAAIISLIKEHSIPAIFTEVNGSDATAQAIARETGAAVYELDMLMSGSGTGLQPYLDAMEANYDTIITALGG